MHDEKGLISSTYEIDNGTDNGTREIQSHCFADELVITHEHSFSTDTQHDYSQVNCRTMSLIIIKLE